MSTIGDEHEVIRLKKVDPSKITSFLGGVNDEDIINRLPKNSTYARLSRGPTRDLPGLHKREQGFTCEVGKHNFLRLYEGDVLFGTTITLNGNASEACVRAYLDDRPINQRNDKAAYYMFEKYAWVAQLKHSGGGCFATYQIFDPELSKTWRESQKEAIGYRLMHIYLREYGADLLPLHRKNLFMGVESFYNQEEYWKEALDLEIILADIGMSSDCEDAIHGKRVPARLGMVGRHSEAALLWSELASEPFLQLLDIKKERHIQHLLQCYNNAAHTHECLLEYSQAEQSWITAIRQSMQVAGGLSNLIGGAVAAEGTTAAEILSYLMKNYDERSRHKSLTSGVAVQNIRVEATLGCLAAAAGFKAPRIEECYRAHGTQLLREKYRQSPKMACKVLQNAFSHPPTALDKFYSSLLYATKNDQWNPVRVYTMRKSSDPSEAAREFKDRMRTEFAPKPLGNIDRSDGACAGCKGIFKLSKLLNCPCRTVSYCGKECQRAHWKESHKLDCPHQKAKKKGNGH